MTTTIITRDILEAYLACRYKANLKLAGEQGNPSDYERMQREARERVRLTAMERLLARHKVEEVPRGLAVTHEVLKRGLPLLLDATAEGEGLSVRFDALYKVPGDSPLGDFHYAPVLFHEAERPSREIWALLALLGAILSAVQGKGPAFGILIHGQDCQVRRRKLTKACEQARRALREVQEARNAPPPRLLLNAHCQVSVDSGAGGL